MKKELNAWCLVEKGKHFKNPVFQFPVCCESLDTGMYVNAIWFLKRIAMAFAKKVKDSGKAKYDFKVVKIKIILEE
jgi:hypothetical protein